MAIVRKIPWTSQPPNPVHEFSENEYGSKCVWAFVPAWGQQQDGKASFRSVGQVRHYVASAGSGGGGGSTDVLAGNYGPNIGSTKALRLRASGATTGYHATNADADLGIKFNDNALTLVAVVKLNGDGVPGGGDPRIYMKGSSWSGADHDLMIGMVSTGHVRSRTRRASTVDTNVTSSLPAADSVCLIGVTLDFNGTNTIPYAFFLDDQGNFDTENDESGAGVYNPRTTTTEAIGTTAGATSQYFDGDIIMVAAFDGFWGGSVTDSTKYQKFFANPWQIFAPRTQIINTHVAAGGGLAISANAGSLTIAGQTPTAATERGISATLGSLTIAGSNPTALLDRTIAASAGALTISGSNPTVSLDRTIAAALGALTITANNATAATDRTIAVALGTLSLGGHNPTVTLAGESGTVARARYLAFRNIRPRGFM